MDLFQLIILNVIQIIVQHVFLVPIFNHFSHYVLESDILDMSLFIWSESEFSLFSIRSSLNQFPDNSSSMRVFSNDSSLRSSNSSLMIQSSVSINIIYQIPRFWSKMPFHIFLRLAVSGIP